MHDILARLGIEDTHSGAAGADGFLPTNGRVHAIYSPGTGELLGRVQLATLETYEQVVADAAEAFERWRMLPAPKRGEIVRQVGEALRVHKDDLGHFEMWCDDPSSPATRSLG